MSSNKKNNFGGFSYFMKGWVYVITNMAMPGLIKVSFSMKDPEIRAIELNHTGTPHPYAVEYDVLVENPHDIEQTIHKQLHAKQEGKEWFRCTPEEAVAAVKVVVGSGALLENYKLADRARVEALHQQNLAKNASEKTRVAQNAASLASLKAKDFVMFTAYLAKKADESSKRAIASAQRAVDKSKTWCSQTQTFLNGDRYNGERKDGERNGYGVQTYTNGDRYEGEWKDGEKNGFGIYTWDYGGRYEGEFRDNKFNGYGIEFKTDGSILKAGFWQDDKTIY
jgi:hypothetical protein